MRKNPNLLTPERASLAEKHRGLAVHLATRYAKRYPRVDLDDLIQDATAALVNSARRHDLNHACPFPAFAMKAILWAIWAHLNQYGFAPKELSLEESLDEETTWADVFDQQAAQREESDRIPDENEYKVADILRGLIRTLPTLTTRERKILHLQYFRRWDVPRIAQHLDRSSSIVSTESARGIRKLRTAMTDLGFKALSSEAPVVGPITGRPPCR